MKALILANGELFKPKALSNRIRAEAFDLVVGADAGALYAKILNVTLNVVIGDLDSISDFEGRCIGNAEFISYPSEKDETDLELALMYAEKVGVNQIVIVGALGGRMDMTIANIMIITCTKFKFNKVEIWHGEQTGWIIKPPGEEISGYPGDTLSLISLGGDAKGITTKGLRYLLKNEDLHFSSGRGISNIMEKTSAYIQLSGGLILAVHTPRHCKGGIE